MIYGKASASGSGFIYSKDGYIVTNAHVVKHSFDAPILVTMWDSRRRRGVVHSLDLVNDIAVLKLVDMSHDEDLPVAKIGSSGESSEYYSHTKEDDMNFNPLSFKLRQAACWGVRHRAWESYASF